MTDKKIGFAFVAVVSACLVGSAVAQDGATGAPATTMPAASGIVSVSDQAALDANKDKDVTLEGVVREASWSGSGKVMNVTFEGADETHVSAVVFSKNKEKIDKAFAGDAAKAWTGAKIRIHGKLREYGGKVEGRKGHPEITISDASQITVVELPTSQPAK